MTEKTHPETRYWGKKISAGGPQPVFKQLLPDGEPTELSPSASLQLRDHSPDGFQWGYSGSGPSQLSLALLLDVTGNPELAQAHYHDFKFYMVASWGEEWQITSQEILEFISSERRRELQETMAFSQN